MGAQKKKASKGPATLSIDIGGTGLKASVLDAKGAMVTERVRMDTPYPCPPPVMVDSLVGLVAPLPRYDRVSCGFPGVVRGGKVVTAAHWGHGPWVGFDLANALAKRLKKPVRVLNDADMQGLAVVQGKGLELVMTLGTGVGSALFRHGRLMPHLELAHHPIAKRKTYNEYLGNEARKKLGTKAWNERVAHMIDVVRTLVNFDVLYLGGGNSARVELELPKDVKIVSNSAGILGGIALWRDDIE